MDIGNRVGMCGSKRKRGWRAWHVAGNMARRYCSVVGSVAVYDAEDNILLENDELELLSTARLTNTVPYTVAKGRVDTLFLNSVDWRGLYQVPKCRDLVGGTRAHTIHSIPLRLLEAPVRP